MNISRTKIYNKLNHVSMQCYEIRLETYKGMVGDKIKPLKTPSQLISVYIHGTSTMASQSRVYFSLLIIRMNYNFDYLTKKL